MTKTSKYVLGREVLVLGREVLDPCYLEYQNIVSFANKNLGDYNKDFLNIFQEDHDYCICPDICSIILEYMLHDEKVYTYIKELCIYYYSEIISQKNYAIFPPYNYLLYMIFKEIDKKNGRHASDINLGLSTERIHFYRFYNEMFKVPLDLLRSLK